MYCYSNSLLVRFYVESYIELDGSQFGYDALLGLDSFFHKEVLFFMNDVDVRKIEKAARHPRHNSDWPKVGIFAQREKNRPNQIGTTICKILKVDGLKIHQPQWASELMKECWE